MKKYFLLLISVFLCFGCSNTSGLDKELLDGTLIELSNEGILVDGIAISDDPHKAIYLGNDIVYYKANQDFTYGEGSKQDEHEASVAGDHQVIHISKAGKYYVRGELSKGQIAIDLGEEAQSDPNAIVSIVLDGVDLTCEVAPALIFYNVYECGSYEVDSATMDVDTTKAGANVIIGDDSINTLNGSYVAEIYKSVVLSDDGSEVVDSERLHKYDGTLYSKQSMNIYGEEQGNGILNINAENEGLCSDLHLSIYGGNINIVSGNDGINASEDNVSLITINDGNINVICDGKTKEGDGIDSNGWLVINGGTIKAFACATSGDAGIDSDKGIYINGGSVVASGNMFDHIAGGDQTYAVFTFAQRQNENSKYTLKNSNDEVVATYQIQNAFTYLVVAGNELTQGDYTFYQDDIQLQASSMQAMTQQPQMPQDMAPPEGFDPNNDEIPQMPEGMTPLEGFDPNSDEIPQKPDGMTPPDDFDPNSGERPQMPEGMTPPEGFDPNSGERPPKDINQDINQELKLSTTFTIKKGANQFAHVSEVE